MPQLRNRPTIKKVKLPSKNITIVASHQTSSQSSADLPAKSLETSSASRMFFTPFNECKSQTKTRRKFFQLQGAVGAHGQHRWEPKIKFARNDRGMTSNGSCYKYGYNSCGGSHLGNGRHTTVDISTVESLGSTRARKVTVDANTMNYQAIRDRYTAPEKYTAATRATYAEVKNRLWINMSISIKMAS